MADPRTSRPARVDTDRAVNYLLEEWADRVRDARRSAELSQLDLARQVGVSQQTISKLEHAEIRPSDPVKLAIAVAFDVEVPELFPWPDREGHLLKGGCTG